MRIAVVGTCASGKTTIVESLQALGFDAYVVGQEHSAVPRLWERQSPDAVVFLHVSLASLRERRSPEWPEWLYRQQQDRLASAREAANVIVDTSEHDIEESLRQILDALESLD